MGAEEGPIEIFIALLKAGADPNAKFDDGFTALHAAAEYKMDRAAQMEALVNAGGDVNVKDNFDDMPLM